ncbi:putative membrane protein [Propionispora sp. 2/2-37]|uniref:YybS family protein n=1 Tax=Propionispora sp. 2/2-37 TaxID=1677858 RepID=UPI0006BB784D|nr:YybS family protein [Propionispora sp. 2/2-37]CUH95815.1 putative membrane protein [Propionispora sp. 2/2-37]
MNHTNIKPVAEGGLLSALAVMMILISVYIPLLGIATAIIWPVPIALLGVRHGLKWSIMATVTSGVIAAMALQPLTALQMVVAFGSIGVVIGQAIRLDCSPLKTMLAASAISFLGILAVLLLGFVIMGVNPLSLQMDMINETFTQVIDMYRSTGAFSEAELANMSNLTNNSLEYLKVIMPGLMTLSAVFYALINFMATKAVLRKLGRQVRSFPPFRHWYLPRKILYIAAVTAVMYYWGNYRSVAPLDDISMNIGLLLIVLFFVQGLSLFYYLADKYNLSRLTKGIILFLTFTNAFFMEMVFFAGLWDVVFDYRKLRTPRVSD